MSSRTGTKDTEGFTAAEREAMKERARAPYLAGPGADGHPAWSDRLGCG